MRSRYVLPVLAAALLAGCKDDDQTAEFDWVSSDLVYSFPYENQRQVPLVAPLVLRFSHALTFADQAELDAQIASQVIVENTAAPGVPVPYTATMVDEKRSLVLQPIDSLAPGEHYTIAIDGLTTVEGEVSVPDGAVDFFTRAATHGPRSQLILDSSFDLQRVIPDASTFPFMDFSNLRLQFTQPLDSGTVSYGLPPAGTISFTDASGNLVPAVVLADGPFLTLDPLEELTPGVSYTLELTSGISSMFGDSLPPSTSSWVPKDSNPREILVQSAPVSSEDPSLQCTNAEGVQVSPLTGDPINCVPVKAVLLGDQSSSQQSGDVRAEIAFVPNYPEVTPLRIKRSTLLTGSNVEVTIAGGVPAGYGTGDISVNFISDAMGYLLPNDYSDAEESPRHVRLIMDVSMSAEDDRANGALSQGLMHIELAGIAIVIDGKLTIDAVGVVEPRVLGIEDAYGVLSFHMEAYADQTAAPAEVVDVTAPFLQSWMPDTTASSMRPGDPILLNFSEALDPVSLQEPGAVTLMKNDVSVPFEQELDGATLIVRPATDLAFGATYEVQVNSLVTDLSGNSLDQDYFLEFDMPTYVAANPRAPIVLTTWPGYACVTVDRDLPNDDHGRCAGGKTTDDHLPVGELEASAPIIVQFSQNLDLNSVEQGGSFLVQRDVGGGVWQNVDGRLEKDRRTLTFYPDGRWQEGDLYRYVLGSNGNKSSSSAVCDGTDAICSEAGYPLQTQLLAQTVSEAPTPTGGGPDMEIYFRAVADAPDVTQVTRNLPTLDVNSNFIHEYTSGEDDVDVVGGVAILPPNSSKLEVTGSNGAVQDANVGCQDGNCPARKVIHLTGGLMAEVVGYDAGEDAVLVRIYPPRMVTTSVTFWADLGILLGGWQSTESGPQIMRARYEDDGSGNRVNPITGWIRETPDGPILEASLQLYLDAPYMEPPLGATHDLRSKEFTLNLSGPIEFLDDGRMSIRQLNANVVNLTVTLTAAAFVDSEVFVEIPVEGVNLTFLPLPVKQ